MPSGPFCPTFWTSHFFQLQGIWPLLFLVLFSDAPLQKANSVGPDQILQSPLFAKELFQGYFDTHLATSQLGTHKSAEKELTEDDTTFQI